MTAFSVDPDALDGVVRRLRADPVESVGFADSFPSMNHARGAFSSDEDNARFNETLDQIIEKHGEIAQMYDNVTERLHIAAENYRNAESTSTNR